MIDLDAIKARCEAATPGPWDFAAEYFAPSDTSIGTYWVWDLGRDGEMVLGGASGEDDPGPDLAFVCAARTDVPALVAEVERLRAELAEARQEARDYRRAQEAEAALMAGKAGAWRVDL